MNIMNRLAWRSLWKNRTRTLVTIIGIVLSAAMFAAVVLADEPTGNLDSKNSQEIVELLKKSNREYGQTLIVITHDESIALQADRILAIEDGRIVRDEVIR